MEPINELLFYLVPLILGNVCGIIIGLIPGIGIVTFLIGLYPLLLGIDVTQIFVFYISILFSTQYYGSVTAIISGVAGEMSSIPAVSNGHHLYRQGLGYEALLVTAMASFLAPLIALIISNILIYSHIYVGYLMSAKVRIWAFILLFTILFFQSQSKYKSVIAIILGLLLGKMGYDTFFQKRLFTFGIPSLDAGLSYYPVFLGIVILPVLKEGFEQIKIVQQGIELSASNIKRTKFWSTLKKYFLIGPWLRGSFVGFFVGLIPGVSYIISSNVAEKIEKIYTGKDNKWGNIISAEGANNAGAVSCLIPFLVFALPIIPSETIVLSLMEHGGFMPGENTFLNNWLYISPFLLLVVGSFNLMLSSYYFKILVGTVLKNQKIIYTVSLIGCMIIFVYTSMDREAILFDTATVAVMYLLGKFLKTESFSFVYAYFIGKEFLTDVTTLIQIYF
jgi:putative tricarboxylic transport membrane protein